MEHLSQSLMLIKVKKENNRWILRSSVRRVKSMHIFAVCIDNSDYQASLEKKKLYEVVPDPEAWKHNQIRIIDESGEDYLFPRGIFLEVPLPVEIAERVARIA